MLAPCDLTTTLTLTSGDNAGTQVTVEVGDMVFTISPATVRLVLSVLKPLQQDQVCMIALHVLCAQIQVFQSIIIRLCNTKYIAS